MCVARMHPSTHPSKLPYLRTSVHDIRTANSFLDVPPVAPGTKATGKLTRVHEQAMMTSPLVRTYVRTSVVHIIRTANSFMDVPL
jgi:hypothetical protein